MQAEVERLESEAKILDRDWKRIPLLVAGVVLAVPVHFIWGPTAAIFAVLAVPCLVGTAFYLIGVRRIENRQNLEELRRQLDASK